MKIKKENFTEIESNKKEKVNQEKNNTNKTSKSNQFEGYYKLKDGAVDMPSSSLFVMPNNKFLFFYYGGYKTGEWKEVDKNRIELTETKKENFPIIIHGKYDKNIKSTNINVYGLANSYAAINFANDTISKKEFQRIFNHGANCLRDQYVIKKKANQYSWLNISLPSDPTFEAHEISHIYEELNYRFPLNKKYNIYTILFNPNALDKNLTFTLSKKNKKYYIDESNEYFEREELTLEMIKKIEETKNTIDKDNSLSKYGDSISCKFIGKTTTENSKQKPIFIAKCEEEEMMKGEEIKK